MTRPRRGGFRQSQRRRTEWGNGLGGTGALAIASSTAGFLGAVLTSVVPGVTLVRTRGELNIVMQSKANAGDGFQGAFGIGKATNAAIAVGISAVPTPITEQEWDGWLFWAAISVHVGDATAGDVNWENATQRITVDSKVMRKIEQEESFYACIEVVELGTSEIDVFFDSRMLVKLP